MWCACVPSCHPFSAPFLGCMYLSRPILLAHPFLTKPTQMGSVVSIINWFRSKKLNRMVLISYVHPQCPSQLHFHILCPILLPASPLKVNNGSAQAWIESLNNFNGLTIQFGLVQAWAYLTRLSSYWQGSSQTELFSAKLIAEPVWEPALFKLFLAMLLFN